MRVDPKEREEMAQKLYEESDRTGVAWVRRPESVKHAFREAAERKLRTHPETHGVNGVHGPERTRQQLPPHRPHGSNHRGKPLMEPSRI